MLCYGKWSLKQRVPILLLLAWMLCAGGCQTRPAAPAAPSSTAAAPAAVPSPLAVLRCEDGRTGFADGFVETTGPVPELLALPDKADG